MPDSFDRTKYSSFTARSSSTVFTPRPLLRVEDPSTLEDDMSSCFSCFNCAIWFPCGDCWIFADCEGTTGILSFEDDESGEAIGAGRGFPGLLGSSLRCFCVGRWEGSGLRVA